jgi:hypothetical protein
VVRPSPFAPTWSQTATIDAFHHADREEAENRARRSLRSLREIDGALIFVRMARGLGAARETARSVKPDGLIWIAYPKGGAMGTDLDRDVLRDSLAKHGLEAVSLIALDATWSAMRFRRSAKSR